MSNKALHTTDKDHASTSTSAGDAATAQALRLLDATEPEPFELGDFAPPTSPPRESFARAQPANDMPPRSFEMLHRATLDDVRSSSSSSAIASPALLPFAAVSKPQASPSRMPREAAGSTSSGHASGKRRATPTSPSFSWNDILHVQNLIERCLQQCLSKEEIVATLQSHGQVEPSFTDVVWQKLEEQNPSFFRAYNLQLQLKDQILAFNYLVAKHKEMTASKRGAHGATSTSAAPNARGFRAALESDSFSSSLLGFPLGSTSSGTTNLMPPTTFAPSSPLSMPLPSPIKSDLDTHAFFT